MADILREVVLENRLEALGDQYKRWQLENALEHTEARERAWGCPFVRRSVNARLRKNEHLVLMAPAVVKHLASSSSPDRLTRPDAAMMAEAPRGRVGDCLRLHHTRCPTDRLFRSTTLEPDKSQPLNCPAQGNTSQMPAVIRDQAQPSFSCKAWIARSKVSPAFQPWARAIP